MIWKSVRAENRRSAAALRENPESLRSQRLGATKPAPRRYMPVQLRKCARKAQNTPKTPKIALIRPRPQMRL